MGKRSKTGPASWRRYPARYESGWFVWSKHRWEQDKRGRVARYAKDMVRTIYAEAAECTHENRRKDIATHAKKSESRDASPPPWTWQNQIGVPISRRTSIRTVVIQLLDGNHKVEEGKIREHRREDYITMITEVRYDRTATCPHGTSFGRGDVRRQRVILFLPERRLQSHGIDDGTMFLASVP
jgi:hypothetical protein